MENRKALKPEIYKAAGERIKRLRKKKGCSRNEMSSDICISGKFLYEIEQGKKGFSSDVLLHIANYLGTDCNYIMTGKIINEGCSVEMLDDSNEQNITKRKKIKKILKLSKEL